MILLKIKLNKYQAIIRYSYKKNIQILKSIKIGEPIIKSEEFEKEIPISYRKFR